jgi:hypothetical protein
VLLDEDIDDAAVDLIVDAEVCHDAHGGLGLSKAIHAAFPLFVAGRIPRQVVVDHRIEVLLEVDALAEAISANQHPPGRQGQGMDAFFALRRRQHTRDRDNVGSTELSPQFLRHIVRRRDETAKHDGMKPFVQEPFHFGQNRLQLLIFRPHKGIGFAGHL